MSSSTLSTVVGASVSVSPFDIKNSDKTHSPDVSRSSSYASDLPLDPGFQLSRYVLLQPLLLPPAYPYLGIP